MTIVGVPTMRKRRQFMMGSVVYHAGSAPHLLDPIPRAVVVPRGAPKRLVEKRTKQEIAAARAEERRR